MTRQEQLDMLENIKNIRAKQELMDTKLDQMEEAVNELRLIRKGHEAATWGEEVAEMEDVNLEEDEDE